MPPLSLLDRCFHGLIIASILVVTGCTATSGKSFLPTIPGYAEKDRELILLDQYLLEISGIFYLSDGRFAGHNDEEGKLYIFNLKDSTHETITFGGKGDYEDVVKVDDFFYVMESDGKLHKVSAKEPFTTTEIKFKKKKKLEFESLYIDSTAHKLVLVTKDHRNSAREILAYTFDLASQSFVDSPYYRISMAAVFARIQDNTVECKPSAAAVHPIEHKVYIVASIGKALIKCSMAGKVEQVFKLNPTQFPQPEGITFAPNGDMYISNEGSVQGKATILKFPYVQR